MTAASVITMSAITADNARVAGDPAVWMTAAGWAATNYLPPVAEEVANDSSLTVPVSRAVQPRQPPCVATARRVGTPSQR